MRSIIFTWVFGLFTLMASAQELPIPRVDVEPADSLFEISGQSPNSAINLLSSDTLPPIVMRVEPGVIAVSIIAGMVGVPAYLYLGFHSYTIGGIKRNNQKAVLPYFLVTRDAQLMEWYRKHRRNRVVWYTVTSGGLLVCAYGFVQLIASIFDPSEAEGAANKLLIGGGLMVGGQLARVATFRNLRQAVNKYNFQYASPHKEVSLHLGVPSQYPAGGAIYLRF